MVGFLVTLQSLLQILDLGLTPTINREIARYVTTGKYRDAGSLLFTLSRLNWVLAGTIASIILFLSPLIAQYWFKSKYYSTAKIQIVIGLIGIVIACRWPATLYQGVLMGAQRIALNGVIGIVAASLSSFGTLILLVLVSPSLEKIFLWQAFIGIIHTFWLKAVAWKVIGKSDTYRFEFNDLKRIRKFSMGMMAIALTAIIFTQLDKIVLSKMLSLEDFGYYMLASAIVNGLYIVATPMFNVMYPRFSSLVVTGIQSEITNLYRLGIGVVSTLIFPLTTMLIIFSVNLVFIWTGDLNTAYMIAPLITLLALGSALHGVMFLPYSLQLAHGLTHLPLTINLILIVILTPMTIIFAIYKGAIGGAMAWLILHILHILLGFSLTHRTLLPHLSKKQIIRDIGIPLLISFLFGLLSYYLIQQTNYSDYLKIFLAGVSCLLTMVCILFLSPNLKFFLQSGFKSVRNVSHT